jgi:hypothetical protein
MLVPMLWGIFADFFRLESNAPCMPRVGWVALPSDKCINTLHLSKTFGHIAWCVNLIRYTQKFQYIGNFGTSEITEKFILINDIGFNINI